MPINVQWCFYVAKHFCHSNNPILITPQCISDTLFSQETCRRMHLYGKNQPSNHKDERIRTFEVWPELQGDFSRVNSRSIHDWCVSCHSTARPCANGDSAWNNGDTFKAIKKTISSNKDAKLTSIRDKLNKSFTYNQICFVLPCMIRDINLYAVPEMASQKY